MIAIYKGHSLISRIIRFANWSPYSHAAIIDPVGNRVIEAWQGRVQAARSLSELHTTTTEVDVFHVETTPEQSAAVLAFAYAQVGKRYDYRGILHFITRRPEYPGDQDRWFCSELVMAAYRAAGIDLLSRVPAFQVYPGMLSYSPLLKLVSTIWTVKPAKAPARPAERGVVSDAPTPAETANPQIAARAEAFAEMQEELFT